MLGHLLPPLGFIPNFWLFRWFLLPGGLEFYFLREQLPRLLEHFATLPVDKTEIGFIDITAKMLVFWAILVEEIASRGDERRIAFSLQYNTITAIHFE